MPVDYSLYLVTDRDILQRRDLLKAVELAVKGGVTLVQLREKNISSREFYNLAVAMKKLTASLHVPLIINDRLDIALAANADGLHIGQDDLPLMQARSLLGKNKILGYSVSTVAEAVYGQEHGADYLGAGTVFPTGNKSDACEPIGLESLKKIKEAVSIPVVGIGGISAANARSVKETGVDGISVISAVLGKEDIFDAASALNIIWRI
jgi:thiamine-phosphate pyrophosphorylase